MTPLPPHSNKRSKKMYKMERVKSNSKSARKQSTMKKTREELSRSTDQRLRNKTDDRNGIFMDFSPNSCQLFWFVPFNSFECRCVKTLIQKTALRRARRGVRWVTLPGDLELQKAFFLWFK